MPSDAQRLAFLRCLLDNGYGSKVLIAHDIHTKHRLVSVMMPNDIMIMYGWVQTVMLTLYK